MAEHLAIVNARTRLNLFRRRKLVWARRRREAPVGRVRIGDTVFFKDPGGLVRASGVVARAREERAGGRYKLILRFRRLRKLAVPFPVVKRDRRSWVTCRVPEDPRQQRLLAARPPTVSDLLRSVRAGRRKLPSRHTVARILAHVTRQGRPEGGLLLWLALLAALAEGDRVTDAVAEYARKPARRVVPFAVFS